MGSIFIYHYCLFKKLQVSYHDCSSHPESVYKPMFTLFVMLVQTFGIVTTDDHSNMEYWESMHILSLSLPLFSQN